ncbi:unnamed protein product [Closterium sp. NIES-65]|nr:unnamed protein product [Closterium sp. NIES-65]
MKQLLSNWRLETGAAKHGAEGGEKGEVGEQGGAEGEEGEAEDRMMERGKGVEGEAAAEQGGAEGEEGEAEDRMNKREKGVEGGASGVEGAAEIVERVNLAAGLEVEEGAKEWDEEEEGVPQPALCHLSTLASLPLTGYCTEEEGGRGGAHINGFPAASQRAAIPNASGARSGAAASHRSASFGGQPPPSMMPGGGVHVPIADAQTPHLGSPASVGHEPGGSSRNPPGSGNLARPGVSSGHGYGSCGGMHQPTPSPGHAAAYSGHSNHELGAIPNGIGGRISGGARAAASAPASPASMGRAPVAHGPSVSHPLNQSASAGSRRPLAAPRPGLGIPLNPGPRPVASVAEQAAMNKYATKGDLAALRTEFLQALQAHTCQCGASGSLGAAADGGENNGGGAGAQYKPKPRTRSVVAIALDVVLAEQKDWRDTHRGGGRERVRSAWARSYSHLFLSLCLLISPPLAGHAQRRREGEAVEMHRGVGKEAVVCVSLHAACIGFDSYPATPLILSSVSVLISLPLAGNAQRWREGEAEMEGVAEVCVGLHAASIEIGFISSFLSLSLSPVHSSNPNSDGCLFRDAVVTAPDRDQTEARLLASQSGPDSKRSALHVVGEEGMRPVPPPVLSRMFELTQEASLGGLCIKTRFPHAAESGAIRPRTPPVLSPPTNSSTAAGVSALPLPPVTSFGSPSPDVCPLSPVVPVVISPGGHVRAQMLQRLLSPSRDDTREQTLVHAAAVTVTTGTTAFDTCSIAAAGEGLQSLPSHVSASVAMLAALGARNCNASLRSATTGANTCAVSRKRSWEQAVMPMQSRQGAEGAIDGQLITSEVSRKRSLSQDSSTGVEGVLDGQLKALLLEMEEEERRAVQAPLVE